MHLVGCYNILIIIYRHRQFVSFYEGNRPLRTPIKAIIWLNNNHSSYATYYSPHCDKNWSPSLLSLSRGPWLSLDVPADAGFLWDKAAVLGKTIRIHPTCLCYSEQRTFKAHALFPGHYVPTNTRTHCTPHPVGTTGSFHWVNNTEEWSWPNPSSCYIKKGRSCKPLPLYRKPSSCRAYVSKMPNFYLLLFYLKYFITFSNL